MKASSKIIHFTRNSLTEYETNYRRVNINLLSAYNALYPSYLARLANVLFINIMSTKRYGAKAAQKPGHEDKRIYSDENITISYILKSLDPRKYASDKSIRNNSSNMIKRIRELSRLNIFYFWRYHHNFIFFMEREIGSWKSFNSEGCVSPKTLKKIVFLANNIIECMQKFEKKQSDRIKKNDIEESFFDFLNEMINKVNPIISSSLPLWTKERSKTEYLDALSKVLGGIDDYMGVVESEDFIGSLPPLVAWKLKDTRERELEKMNESQLEKELVSQNSLIGAKSERKRSKTKPSNGGIKATMIDYDQEDTPFKNSRDFMMYYRDSLRAVNGKMRFENFTADAHAAGEILDLLEEHKRKNKLFLDEWIKYFMEHKLRGKKVYNTKYTSLKAFKESFERYNEIFYLPQ